MAPFSTDDYEENLVTRRAVEYLAQNVGVAAVSCVLLDHVEVDPAQVHLAAVAQYLSWRVEVACAADDSSRRRSRVEEVEDLFGRVTLKVVEVGVGVVVTVKKTVDFLTLEDNGEPVQLDEGHVLDESKERES